MAHSMDFFRRNMKPLMAALTLMAMISFVFIPEMRSGNNDIGFLVPVIFGLLAGGAGFIWGTRTGRQNEFLAMGLVVGIVFGLIIKTFGVRDNASQATVAGLTQRDIASLKNRRETANRIVASLYRKSHPIPKEVFDRGPFMLQFFQMQMEQALSRVQFHFGRDLDQDVVFGHLLRQEGQRLGIAISDEAISDFIKMVADNKLSTDDFQAVRQELHLTDHHIYEILRDELAARRAAELTFPRIVSTPEQLWQDFRKVAVKQQIEATTIPVDPFVKSISEPSASELSAFCRNTMRSARISSVPCVMITWPASDPPRDCRLASPVSPAKLIGLSRSAFSASAGAAAAATATRANAAAARAERQRRGRRRRMAITSMAGRAAARRGSRN